jgi:hypothetical protein
VPVADRLRLKIDAFVHARSLRALPA